MKNENFTIKIYKGWKVKVNKLFLPVKIGLFCWFAGANIKEVYIPVYLKSKGFTIAHLSIFTATGIIFQFLSNVLSGIIVDKTGRSKPVILTYLTVFLLNSLSLILMPSINDCSAINFQLECNKDGNSSQRFTITPPCASFEDKSISISCFIEKMENTTNTGCKSLNYTSSASHIELKIKDTVNDSDTCIYDVNLRNRNMSNFHLCDTENCISFYINCTKEDFVTCNSRRGFWVIIYGIMININLFSLTTTYRLFDVIVADLTNENNSDFGRQRIFAILGALIGPSLTGYILHACGISGEHQYSLAFMVSGAFTLFSALAMNTVFVKSKTPATQIWEQSLKLLTRLDVFLFLLLAFIMGSVFSFQVTYSNWFLQDLGGSDLLLGLNRGIESLCGLPFLYPSRWFIDKIGERNLFLLGLIGHATYCFSYSLLKEPWLSLTIQSTLIFSYHLFWVAVIHHIVKITPEGVQATMKILAGNIHYSIGKVLATMIGGIVMNELGGRIAFRVLGSIVLFYAAIYGIYVFLNRTRKHATYSPSQKVQDECSL